MRRVNRLYDCVVFNDELDLLEVRLRTAAPYVDVFVIVEATRTFSGDEKPLVFGENRERFKEWHDQIRHIVVDDLPPPVPTRWVSEVFQRDAIRRGLHDAQPEDIIIVADADELIHPEVLATMRTSVTALTGLGMASTFHRANWELPLGMFALAARAVPFAQLSDSPHNQRNHVAPTSVIPDAGRHLTYLLDAPAIIAMWA